MMLNFCLTTLPLTAASTGKLQAHKFLPGVLIVCHTLLGATVSFVISVCSWY